MESSNLRVLFLSHISKYKTISRIIQFFVEDSIELLESNIAGNKQIRMKWETSVSPTNLEYKTISRIIQIFVADFVTSLRDSAQTLFSDFVAN